MIRIAVCDDEPAFAERVKTLIEEECRVLSVSSETVLYTDSGMLAYEMCIRDSDKGTAFPPGLSPRLRTLPP